MPFIFASGSDFVEMYAGVGAARVRRLFKDARRHKSCIIFIDELDAVGRSRGGSSLSHEEREQTLNQLLVEMDGFEASTGIVVIAATNRQDILDPALLRPGRFDRQVMVGNPDLKGREAILGVHGRKVTMGDDVNLRSIARGTPGFSGADLANLVNEAALAAGRGGRDQVSGKDMESARDKVLMGVERRSVVLSELDRVNCAYHEAGHAVVAALLPMADPLHKVTIIPRGRAMGVTMQLPEADRHTYTKGYLETQIAVLMGGRVAEELFMNHMTSGASNDIERATDIAQHMVCEWGMSALGMRAFRKAGNSFEADKAHAMSEATARRVDEEIEKVINGGYDRAYDLLNRNREAVKAIAEALLDQEALDADELKALLAQANATRSVEWRDRGRVGRSGRWLISSVVRGCFGPTSVTDWSLLLLTVVYAVLQVGFVRPHLPARSQPNLARPPADRRRPAPRWRRGARRITRAPGDDPGLADRPAAAGRARTSA